MGFTEFLEAYEIPYTTSGKHARAGWIQIECPFCEGNPGYHGGVNLKKIYYNCWRCGWHHVTDLIQALVGVSRNAAKGIIRDYDLVGDYIDDEQREKFGKVKLIMPPHASETKFHLTTRHQQYLVAREFSPLQIQNQWGVYSASHIGAYKFRMVIPIRFQTEIVSFTTRTASNQEPKYLSCPKDMEIIPHKEILYGFDALPTDHVIVVEGPIDVWRFDRRTVATFGINYSRKQLLLLAKTFSKITVVFDNEEEAQVQAYTLAAELMGLGRLAEVRTIPTRYKDPADMSQEDANLFTSSLLPPI
jgi:hypothetical protein